MNESTIFAFPSEEEPGMTLRDYFAGQVIIGMYAESRGNYIIKVEFAYKIASLMLKEREKYEV